MIVGRVTVQMKSAKGILKDKGLTGGGDVQRFFTQTVFNRIHKYMPHRSGALETKLTHIKSDTEIETLGPYAQYQYHGKAMEGKPPMSVTDRDLHYTKTKNPLAGPKWDRALVAAEMPQIQGDVQAYLNRKAGGK